MTSRYFPSQLNTKMEQFAQSVKDSFTSYQAQLQQLHESIKMLQVDSNICIHSFNELSIKRFVENVLLLLREWRRSTNPHQKKKIKRNQLQNPQKSIKKLLLKKYSKRSIPVSFIISRFAL